MRQDPASGCLFMIGLAGLTLATLAWGGYQLLRFLYS